MEIPTGKIPPFYSASSVTCPKLGNSSNIIGGVLVEISAVLISVSITKCPLNYTPQEGKNSNLAII